MKKYFGVIPPIITPVDEKENVDEAGFRKLLRHCAKGGLHGMFVAGSNGETMALTQEQRDRAIKIAIDEVGKDMPVMAGVMDSSTRRVIDNIKKLEQMGGTCAVVTSIFYARHTSQDETVRHFERISRETNIDVLIYNIPMFTGLSLAFDTVKKISAFDRVVGYKDSGGNFPDFQKCLSHFKGKDFCLLQGSTPLAAASMLMGADGFIPSIAPVFPELFVKFYEAGKARNIDRTMELNNLISDTSAILGMSKNATASNKFAISQLGFTHKRVIAPQDSTTPADEENIVKKIAEINASCKKVGIL
ncbi:MAG: dihydrodipicolinate synthase family protein [Treponemataceae bacterium]